MSTAPARQFTSAEYLAFERDAETKHEFFAGEIFAMAGASPMHNLIASNLVRELSARLKERPCRVFGSDQRVKVDVTGLYTYPDVTVVCGEMEFDDDQKDSLLNPRVIIEVLSEATESYDRGKKFEHYRRLPSLQEYLLVAQDKMHVERYRRRGDHEWLLWETDDRDGVVSLASIEIDLPMAEIYDKVTFEAG